MGNSQPPQANRRSSAVIFLVFKALTVAPQTFLERDVLSSRAHAINPHNKPSTNLQPE